MNFRFTKQFGEKVIRSERTKVLIGDNKIKSMSQHIFDEAWTTVDARDSLVNDRSYGAYARKIESYWLFPSVHPVDKRLRPLIVGGHQERGRRAGTENVASCVALGAACRLAALAPMLLPSVPALNIIRPSR